MWKWWEESLKSGFCRFKDTDSKYTTAKVTRKPGRPIMNIGDAVI